MIGFRAAGDDEEGDDLGIWISIAKHNAYSSVNNPPANELRIIPIIKRIANTLMIISLARLFMGSDSSYLVNLKYRLFPTRTTSTEDKSISSK